MPPQPHYRAPAWLRGPHMQTIWPSLFAPKPQIDYVRERWNTPDGDFIVVDFTRAPVSDASTPLLVVFHGLEGDSSSHYALALMAEARRRGWRGAVPHFRGCGGTINLAPRAYHSGDSDEIDWILRRFERDHARGAPLLAVGISLGGNALLKWLGERAESARFVRAAAAVSAPQDLEAGAEALARGFSRLYTQNFLRTLKAQSLRKLEQHPGLFDRERMLAARNFHDFDDVVTAPMHGFRDCRDYWTRSSCRQHLAGIRVPALVLNALNDPFLPAHALARPEQVSPQVRLEYPTEGGHVGFIAGQFPGTMEWLSGRLLDFLAAPEPHGVPAHTESRTDANG